MAKKNQKIEVQRIEVAYNGINGVWIEESLPQPERLQRLNQVAIQKMQLLTQDSAAKKLKGGKDE